nr:MAG TPA: hypothetical protein [Caudoviricetes sp.]
MERMSGGAPSCGGTRWWETGRGGDFVDQNR